jgi:FAD synthetase
MAKLERVTLKKRRKIVLASGTFDLLHLGHVRYLEEAKKAGGRNAILIVIVAKDETVQKRKGARPIMPEEHRRALVESLKVVDKAILGFKDLDILAVIEEVKPDFIAVGYDQNSIEEQVSKIVAQQKLSVQIVKISKFGKDELDSSVKIKRRITQLYRS